MLLLPTYNNADAIGGVLDEIAPHVPRLARVVVVDDGCTDGTAAILARYPWLEVLRHPKNAGKGKALHTGFAYAREHGLENVIVMDADGQHRAEDLPKILKKLDTHRGHIVIGARDMRREVAGDVPGASLFGRAISNFWVWVETGVHLPDTQSGFRAYPVARLPLGDFTTSRYDFEIEVLVRAIWRGTPVCSEQVSVFYPLREERVTHFDQWKDNVLLTKLHTRLVIMRILSILTGASKDGMAARLAKILRRAQGTARVRETPGAALLGLCMRLFGPYVCYLFAPVVLLVFCLFGRNARAAIDDFYAHLEPESPEPRFFRSYRNFLFFGASLIDRLALARGRFPALSAVTIANRPKRPEGPAILVGAHFGDWTFCGSAIAEKFGQKIGVVMDLSRSPRYQALVRERSKGRFELIDTNGGLDFILKAKAVLDAGGLLCFLGDRGARAEEPESQITLPFLDQAAVFPRGPFELAARFGCPVHSFFCLKRAFRPKSPYVIYIDEIWHGQGEMKSAELARRFTARFEQHVRRDPRHWFNFFPFWGTLVALDEEARENRLREPALR